MRKIATFMLLFASLFLEAKDLKVVIRTPNKPNPGHYEVKTEKNSTTGEDIIIIVPPASSDYVLVLFENANEVKVIKEVIPTMVNGQYLINITDLPSSSRVLIIDDKGLVLSSLEE